MVGFRHIERFSDIAQDYRLLFCDVWGVVHNGREAFEGACRALTAFREGGGGVVLVTNAPVPEHRVVSVMDRLGVPESSYDCIATSGDATRRELAKRGGPVYVIGVEGDDSVYRGLDLKPTSDPAEARVICATSLRDYPNDEPGRYRDELKALAGHRLEMICANPDVQFRHGDRLIWSAGALAELYESFGGRVIRPGKPDAAIYALAREEASNRGFAFEPQSVLAIGDGPETDIRGAMKEGVASLFIGGGIHGHELAFEAEFGAEARALLEGRGVAADYVSPYLSW